jgi:hypothetical protein
MIVKFKKEIAQRLFSDKTKAKTNIFLLKYQYYGLCRVLYIQKLEKVK